MSNAKELPGRASCPQPGVGHSQGLGDLPLDVGCRAAVCCNFWSHCVSTTSTWRVKADAQIAEIQWAVTLGLTPWVLAPAAASAAAAIHLWPSSEDGLCGPQQASWAICFTLLLAEGEASSWQNEKK